MTALLELLRACNAHGIRLSSDGQDGLKVDAPKEALTDELISALKEQKSAILVALRAVQTVDINDLHAVWLAALDLLEGDFPPDIMEGLRQATLHWADSGSECDRRNDHDRRSQPVEFDWDTSPGYCPGQRIIRNGIEHKLEACSSKRSWLHVCGGRYCLDCWPCRDDAAMADAGDE
jgi:hypothetical protein